MTKNPIMLAALATAALALGACGSGGDDQSGSPKKGGDKAYEGALKFAKCMRDEGIDMPDPQRSGNGGILQKMGGPGKPVNQAKAEAAQKKCEHFLEAGGGSGDGPGDDPKQRDALLKYSKCMRDHGLDGFPDPKFSGNKVELSIRKGDGAANLNPESPAFKAADKACQKILADLRGGGPGSESAQEAG